MEKRDTEGRHQWDYYKTQIDLIEFAQWKGYVINPQKTSRNYVVLKKEGDIIIVYQNQYTGYQGYFNPIDTKDSGNILTFAYNRNKQGWRAVFAALDGFLHDLETGTLKRRKHVLRPTAPPQAEYDPDYDFKFLEPFDFSYLNQRGIHTTTILADSFQGQLFNKTFTHNGIVYVNTAFPLRNQTGVVAAIVRNAQYNKIERPRGDACWVSNVSITDNHPITMVITESPIDALSYHQLYLPLMNEGRLYVATAGNLSETQPQYIQYLIDVYQPQQIVLANDNDKGGVFQNIKLLSVLSHPTYASNLHAAIELQGQKVIFSFQSGIDNPENDKDSLEKMVERYFKTGKKFVASRNDGWVDVHLDNTATHMEELEKLLIAEKNHHNRIKVHKPRFKDFNEDLQQLAKRDPNYSDMSL